MATENSANTPTLTPALDVPEELRAIVSTTFTHTCPWGCTVRVVESEEQPHVCVGEQVIAAVAPELRFQTAQQIASGLAPLLRQLLGQSWDDGMEHGAKAAGDPS